METLHPDDDNLQSYIDLLPRGDDDAIDRLLKVSAERLSFIARDLLNGDRLARWEEPDDLLQESWITLRKSLQNVKPSSVREFYGLASFHMRRALIKFARRHYGANGLGVNYRTPCDELLEPNADSLNIPSPDTSVATVYSRAEMQLLALEAIGHLPQSEREVSELIWLQGLSRVETADLLGIDERTVRRRWQRARLALLKRFNDNGTV